MTDANGNFGRGPNTPPYAFRAQVDPIERQVGVHEERLDGLEVELARQTLERSALMDKFEEHEAADAERHTEVLARLDRLDERIDRAIRDAAGARALAERQPSQAEAVLVDMARADIEAAKERRAHLWAGARRVGAWLLGGGGMAVLGAAAARACGG